MASTQLEIVLVDGNQATHAAADQATATGARPAAPSAVPQGSGRSMPGASPVAASGPKFGDRSSPNYREAGAPVSAELAKLQKSVSSIFGKTAVGSGINQAVGVSRQMAQLMEAVQARAQRQGTADEKLPDDAPRREDFRDLRTSIEGLTRRTDRGEGASQPGLSKREQAKIEAQLAEMVGGDLSKMNPATRASMERQLAEKFGIGRKQTPAPIEPPGNVERRPGAPPVQRAADPQTALGRLGDRIGRAFRQVEDRVIGGGRRARGGADALREAARRSAADVAEGARVVGRRVAGSRLAQGARRGLSAAGRNVSEFGAGLGRTRVGAAVGRGGAAVARRTGMTAAAGTVGRFVAGRGAMAAGTAAVAGGSTVAGAGAAAALGGPLGLAVGATVLALGALVLSVKKTSDAFSGVAGKLEDVSAPIAAARASTERQSERSRIDRANELGPQLANLEAARGRLGNAAYGLGTDLMSEVLKIAPLIEMGVDGVTVVIEVLRLMKETVDVGLAALPTSDLDAAKEQEEMIQALGRLGKALTEFKRTGDPDLLHGRDRDLMKLLDLDVDENLRQRGGGADGLIPNMEP